MHILLILLAACGRSEPEVPAAPAPEAPSASAPAPRPERPKTGLVPLQRKLPEGGCVYEPFEVPCELRHVEMSTMSTGRIRLEGLYAPEGHPDMARWSLIATPDREADLRAHFEANRSATCMGRRLVEGDCGPGRWRVKLPSLPVPPAPAEPAAAPPAE